MDVKFWTDDQCSKAFEADYGHKFVNGSEICAYEEVSSLVERIAQCSPSICLELPQYLFGIFSVIA